MKNTEKITGLQFENQAEGFAKALTAIQYLIYSATGVEASVYSVVGTGNKIKYQIMPDHEFLPEVADFWFSYAPTKQQYFSSPVIAAAEFVKNYNLWRHESGKL